MPTLPPKPPRPASSTPRPSACHLDRLMRAALAMSGSRADAEDLVQEVCLRVLAKPRLVRGNDLAYLHGVLRNTFITDYQTRARRRTTPVEPELARARPRRPPLRPRARARSRARCTARSPTCPAHYRDAVVAVDVLGLAYAEAAEALGVPDGTIMSRLYRGRTPSPRASASPSSLAA